MRELIVAIITLIVGFIFLIKGADFFVDGSASVAKRLRVPSIIIGMTVVAMGTSLPECAVSVTASITNNNSLAVSNAVGSNIFNLMVVCGVCALFTPLAVQRDTLKRDLPFSIIVAGLLLVLGYFGMTLGRVDGIILLVVFAVFLVIMVKSALKARRDGDITAAEQEDQEIADEVEILPVWKCIVFIVVGAIGIALGGDAVVNGASVIAAEFGLSQTLIGLTIVALGTSLPELVTSIVAARKNEVDMALGNVIGSNIFNILFVLGIAAAISPIQFIRENIIDIILLIFMSLDVWFFAQSKKKLTRGEGIVMLLVYAVYMVYICKR